MVKREHYIGDDEQGTLLEKQSKHKAATSNSLRKKEDKTKHTNIT